ncbi:MAG: hypothetical protein D3903_15190 [Candidatus Electrothrix sp. GM3_4]|nr:hypothetical protein [Candidatus Electrothrix sp. GM3_4]
MTRRKKCSQAGMYIGIGALLAMVAVVALNWNSPNTSIPAILIVLQVIAGAGFGWPAKHVESVEQSTRGDHSAAINTRGKVSINYGGSSSGEKSATNEDVGEGGTQSVSGEIRQAAQGEKSPAVNTKGDVEISYGE